MICLISMGQISGLGRGDNQENKSLSLSLNSCCTAGPDKTCWLQMKAAEHNCTLHHWLFNYYAPWSDVKWCALLAGCSCLINHIFSSNPYVCSYSFKLVTVMSLDIYFLLWCGLLTHYKQGVLEELILHSPAALQVFAFH